MPFSDDDAVGETVGIAKPTVRHAERRIDIGNAVDAGVAGQVGDLECDRASGIDAGHDEGRRAARRVVRLVGRDGHRFRCRRNRAWSVARPDREQRRSLDYGSGCAPGRRHEARQIVGLQRRRRRAFVCHRPAGRGGSANADADGRRQRRVIDVDRHVCAGRHVRGMPAVARIRDCRVGKGVVLVPPWPRPGRREL